MSYGRVAVTSCVLDYDDNNAATTTSWLQPTTAVDGIFPRRSRDGSTALDTDH